jgi:hypothetical protein
MHTLLQLRIFLLSVEVEPVQPTVEDTRRQTAPTLIEKVSNGEYLFRKTLLGLQHLRKTFGEVVAVEVQ